MIIYKCALTGDEMFSDIYKITESDDGIFYQIKGKVVTRTDNIDESKFGANASAEEACEENTSGSVSGVDIVLNHNLQETGFDKKTYTAYIKEYMKTIKKRIQDDDPEKVKPFETKASAAVKAILQNFKNYQFFTGENMNPDGMVALLDYCEDGTTPIMFFFKHGLIEEKC